MVWKALSKPLMWVTEESRHNTPATVVRDEVHEDSVNDASTSTTDQKKVGGRNLI